MGTLPAEQGIAGALFGKAQRAVLGLLFCHSDEAFHLREIARRAGVSLGSAQREMERLAGAGLVTRERRGNLVLFQANRESPVFEELRGLMVKTAGVADVLRQALSPLAGRIGAAFIFGSVAKGRETARSDVDVMVVGDVTFAEVVDALQPAQDVLSREVNPSVFPAEEIRERVARADHFLTAVLEEPKVLVLGDADELDRLAAVRVGGPKEAERAGDRRAPDSR